MFGLFLKWGGRCKQETIFVSVCVCVQHVRCVAACKTVSSWHRLDRIRCLLEKFSEKQRTTLIYWCISVQLTIGHRGGGISSMYHSLPILLSWAYDAKVFQQSSSFSESVFKLFKMEQKQFAFLLLLSMGGGEAGKAKAFWLVACPISSPFTPNRPHNVLVWFSLFSLSLLLLWSS